MENDRGVGKSIYEALAVILAVVILIVLVCFFLLLFVFNGDNNSEVVSAEQEVIKVVTPGKSELRLNDRISLSAEGYVKNGSKKPEKVKEKEKKKEEKKEVEEKEEAKEEEREVEEREEAKEEVKEEEGETTTGSLSGDYICPTSNTQLLTSADIAGLSAQELNYAKNEIYARHGRKFDSPELQNYFNSKRWYNGIYDGKDFDANYSNSLLSDIEKKNAEILRAAENGNGGYGLDQ